MAARLGIRIGIWLYKHQAISQSQIDEIRYAVEIICSEFLEIFIIIVYSLMSRKVIQTVMFLITFQILRNLYDGYHAKTIMKCLIITISVYLAVLSLHVYLSIELSLTILFFITMMQLCHSRKNHVWKPLFITIVLVILSMIMQIFGFKGCIQILTVTEIVVLISYMPVRRLT